MRKTEDRYLRKRPHRARRLLSRLALLLSFGLVFNGVFFHEEAFSRVPSANAAMVLGPGVSLPGFHFGAFKDTDGTYLYCLEISEGYWLSNSAANAIPSAQLPSVYSAAQSNGSYFWGPTFTAAISRGEEPYDRISYILAAYGQTNNNMQAAAVALSIWAIRGENGKGTGDYQRMLNDYKSMTEAALPGTINLMNQILLDSKNWYDTHLGLPQGDFQLVQGPTPYSGQITVPAGTKEVRLQGAVFNDGQVSKSWPYPGLSHEEHFEWVGKPPTGWDRFFTVSAQGEKHVTEMPLLAPTLNHPGQRVTPIPPPPKKEVVSLLSSELVLDTIWAPELSTQTPTDFVSQGQEFSDSVYIFASEADSLNTWRVDSDNNYMPIVATGTLYGPFTQDPSLTQAAEPPAGAPVAGQYSVTTSPESGPGVYEVLLEGPALESGFYSWVWNISWENQLAEVREPESGRPAIPENYFFTDGFGQVTEGQVTPNRPLIRTEVDRGEVRVGDYFADLVSVDMLNGVWMRDQNGIRVPFNAEGRLYLSRDLPVRAPEAAEDSQQVGIYEQMFDKPGSELVENIRVPVLPGYNYATIQWCFFSENQPAGSVGLIDDTCDDYGVPTETVRVLNPRVETIAKPFANQFGEIFDTASVSEISEDIDAEIGFELYLTPKVGEPKYDQDWNPVTLPDGQVARWTVEEIENHANICKAQMVATTASVPVRGSGNYISPSVTAKSGGETYWVEKLYLTDPETGEQHLFHEGECGIANEKTVIEPAAVTTKAQETALVGETMVDTAIVTGLSDEVGAEIEFIVYLVPQPGAKKYDSSWEETGEVWTAEEIDSLEDACTTQPVAVTDRVEVVGAGEYVSPAVSAKTSGVAYWVERLFVQTESGQELVHEGACGIPNERTSIVTPELETTPTPEPLPDTGAGAGVIAIYVLVAVLVIAGGIIIVARRSSQM